MCGFVGLVQRRVRRKQDELVTDLRNSARIISHRGPDDAQEWVAEDASAGFGFRRLSIRDLSSAGRQPMSSRCSRYTMVFNGEIYNHLDIRKELETVFASEWDGHSDSETLLIAISLWGLEKTLSVIDGMFAIALWDDREKKLYLVRDRFGEKPLYYTHQEDTLYFASELKALSPLGASVGGIDKGAVITFFRLRYIPAPKTIYNNVYKVMPGEILVYDQGATGGVSTKKYWDSLHEAAQAHKNPYQGSKEEVLDQIDVLLNGLVNKRLAADTPLGTFLSGGIDSSLVTALAQKQSAGDINTYTIRFEDHRYNEADEALEVARQLGTQHTEMPVTEQDALNLVEKIPHVYDEPFADPSQIPTMLLCQMAKKHVTVALSGDGGDEFFGGYTRYLRIQDDWGGKSNGGACYPLTRSLAGLPWGLIDKGAGLFRRRPSRTGPKIIKGLRKNCAGSLIDFSQHYSSFWRDALPLKGISEEDEWQFDRVQPLSEVQQEELGVIKSLMVADSLVYLPDDLMVKVDRASMAASLEVRTPFLNLDLAKLCWSLPDEWHASQNLGSKQLLREVLYRYVPQSLVDRPKKGFDVPLRDWLRGDLKPWGDELVHSDCIQSSSLLDMKMIRGAWAQHQKGANREGDLWPALMFLAWYRDR